MIQVGEFWTLAVVPLFPLTTFWSSVTFVVACVIFLAVLVSHLRRTRRFSLRTMLSSVAVIAVLLAVVRWNTVVGMSLAVFVAGTVCVVIGVRTSRRGIVSLGILLMIGAGGFAWLRSVTVVAWVGNRYLEVHVLVVDGSSLAPVSGARVQLLSGPGSPIEGSVPNVENDFTMIELAGDKKGVITNEQGSAKFRQHFRAGGTDGLFRKSGYVDTRRTWLRVTAPNYQTTLMPMDGQSAYLRDVNDETPLFITVPVGKK